MAPRFVHTIGNASGRRGLSLSIFGEYNMSSPVESRQARMIEELRVFIKKVMSDPTIAVKSMEIARKYKGEANADELMAREISANTTIRIPESWSEADKMFLEILHEVLDDEEALY
tara:strand:+ start:388 stop:735 length:348 start_codon:yes stop_codon:yes gene_type:complete